MYAITKDGDGYRQEWWDGDQWVSHSRDAIWYPSRAAAEAEARSKIATRPLGNWSVVHFED